MTINIIKSFFANELILVKMKYKVIAPFRNIKLKQFVTDLKICKCIMIMMIIIFVEN